MGDIQYVRYLTMKGSMSAHLLPASHVGTKKARDCMFRWNQFNVTETLQTFTLDQEIMLVSSETILTL